MVKKLNFSMAGMGCGQKLKFSMAGEGQGQFLFLHVWKEALSKKSVSACLKRVSPT
jgi:hypothetical protein